jgi:tetratricopeptide (TPR) repeat protein
MQEILNEEMGIEPLGYGEGGFLRFLRKRDVPPEIKLKVVTTLEQNKTPKEIILLKEALSSEIDEVRLFAFSALSRLEESISVNVEGSLKRLKKAEDEKEKALIKKDIASLYWEMIYFGVVDEEIRSFMVSEIERYAEETEQTLKDDPECLFLRSRIKLKKGEYEEAERLMKKVLESGFMKEKVIPYLAEVYYVKGETHKVEELFNNFYHLRLDPVLNPIVELWSNRAYQKSQ